MLGAWRLPKPAPTSHVRSHCGLHACSPGGGSLNPRLRCAAPEGQIRLEDEVELLVGAEAQPDLPLYSRRGQSAEHCSGLAVIRLAARLRATSVRPGTGLGGAVGDPRGDGTSRLGLWLSVVGCALVLAVRRAHPLLVLGAVLPSPWRWTGGRSSPCQRCSRCSRAGPGVAMSTGVAVGVLAGWTVIPTIVGAWRTSTCDA